MKPVSGPAAFALAATTLTTTLVAAALSPSASAVSAAEPAPIAGDWIVGQLTSGLAVGDYGPDLGLSIDAGLALQAIGRTSDAELINDTIAPGLVTEARNEYGYVKATEYAWTAPYAEAGVGRYANATAKAAAFTERLGRDARAQYADVDLIAQLEELTSDSTGRIADASTYGNYANTIGQSFAVEALTASGSSEAAMATTALLARQCPEGYFPLSLSAACDAAAVPGPDVTALAVISLVRSKNTSVDVASAIVDATTWLESVQGPDGAVVGASSPEGSNANSTGLSAWALGEAGRTHSAARAAAWTRALQVADAGGCVGKAPTGAIAYNPVDLASAREDGLTTKRDTWRRATFQAAPALSWAPAATAPLSISTPASAVENSTVEATVRGLAQGQQACVTFGATSRRIVGTGSDLTESFDLPAGAGEHTFSLATLAGTTSSTTTVPGPAPAAPAPTSPAPTSPAPTSPAPTIPAPVVPVVGGLRTSDVERVRDGAIALAVRCAAPTACGGTLTVRTRGKVRLAEGRARRVVVARSAYVVEPGTTEKVVLRVRKPIREVLRTGRLPVAAKQVATGADTVRTPFWLRRA